MEIRIVSKKLMTPSPSHDRDHPPNMKLSSFDQLSVPIYFSIIFYYSAESSSIMNFTKAQRLQMLEKSLADALSVFYPLAGRYIQESFSIECNNRGVEFCEAQVIGSLNTVLLQLPVDAKLVSQFVPPHPLQHSPSTPLLLVQASFFECGGVAIGLRVSHIVADMHSLTSFCNTWAAACKSSASASPSFDMASMFPPRDDLSAPRPFAPPRAGSSLDVVTKRLVFQENALSRLKLTTNREASKVQTVTALIWKILIKIDAAKHGHLRSSMISHAFNVRGKVTNLPIPDNCFGNMWWSALPRFTPYCNGNGNDEFVELVGVVRDSIESVRSSVRACGDYEDMLLMARKAWEELREAGEYKEEVDYASHFSSWCRMGHYDVDFGWGKPTWVSSQHIPFDGFVILLDSRDGEGIEAWVSLLEDKMLLFQHHPEIITFTTM